MIAELFPKDASAYLESLYKSMKRDPLVKSFYFAFLKHLFKPYLDMHGIECQGLDARLKAFLNKKEEAGEIVLGHTVNCISCRKKVLGPYVGNRLPRFLKCPWCGTTADTKNDFLLQEDRYFFTGKQQKFEEVSET